jgi:hypothetical protein
MIRAVALGLLLVVTTLLTGCGILVVDEAPTEEVRISAPPLVDADLAVEALTSPQVRSPSRAKTRRVAQRAALEIRIPACDDDEATGRGFALDARTLVAAHDAIPGGGWVRVSTRNRQSTAVGAAGAYRVGELGIARVARRLPRRLTLRRSVPAGLPVVAVAERDDKLRMLPGVVVDSVPGAPYGVPAKVLRLTSAVREGDAGPVLDAKGRIVAVVFAIDERTTLGVAIPAATLRELAATRRLEARDACA